MRPSVNWIGPTRPLLMIKSGTDKADGLKQHSSAKEKQEVARCVPRIDYVPRLSKMMVFVQLEEFGVS